MDAGTVEISLAETKELLTTSIVAYGQARRAFVRSVQTFSIL